jgi:hypothetical protein
LEPILSRRPVRLHAAITANGFGHAVQTGAAVAGLRRLLPGLSLSVRSAIPRRRIEEVIAPPFDLIVPDDDFGVVLRSATELDLPATRAAYGKLAARWDAVVAAEAALLRRTGAGLVLSNASAAAVAGAREAGVPVALMATLTWGDILAGLFPGDADMLETARRLHACYARADLVLRPAPSMPFAGARRIADTGPIGRRGTCRRDAIAARLGMTPGERLVLAALGGMGDAPPAASWPAIEGVRFLVPAGAGTGTRVHDLSALGLPFEDVLASLDAFIGKPGYGSVAGAAIHGVPFLYLRRGDWPEEPWLLDWLHANARAAEIPRAALEAGDVLAALDALWAAPPRPPVPATGATEAAGLIAGLLHGG